MVIKKHHKIAGQRVSSRIIHMRGSVEEDDALAGHLKPFKVIWMMNWSPSLWTPAYAWKPSHSEWVILQTDSSVRVAAESVAPRVGGAPRVHSSSVNLLLIHHRAKPLLEPVDQTDLKRCELLPPPYHEAINSNMLILITIKHLFSAFAPFNEQFVLRCVFEKSAPKRREAKIVVNCLKKQWWKKSIEFQSWDSNEWDKTTNAISDALNKLIIAQMVCKRFVLSILAAVESMDTDSARSEGLVPLDPHPQVVGLPQVNSSTLSLSADEWGVPVLLMAVDTETETRMKWTSRGFSKPNPFN